MLVGLLLLLSGSAPQEGDAVAAALRAFGSGNLATRIRHYDAIADSDAADLEARILPRLAASAAGEDPTRIAVARGIAEALARRKDDRTTIALLDAARPRVERQLRLAALRSLAVVLADPVLGQRHTTTVMTRLKTARISEDLEIRDAATEVIGSLPATTSRPVLKEIVLDSRNAPSHRILALRLLARKVGWFRLSSLLPKLAHHRVMAEAFAALGREDGEPLPVEIVCRDGGVICGRLTGLRGTSFVIVPRRSERTVRIPLLAIRTMSAWQPGRRPARGTVLVVDTGSALYVEDLRLDRTRLRARFGNTPLTTPRHHLARIQRGSPPEWFSVRGPVDRISRGLGPDCEVLRGKVLRIEGGEVQIQDHVARTWKLPLTDSTTVTLARPGPLLQRTSPRDASRLVRIDMTTGERVVGYPIHFGPRGFVIVEPVLGCIEVAPGRMHRLRPSPPNFFRHLTLITDYGNVRVALVDDSGTEVWHRERLHDPVDAEVTPQDTVLVTEQGDNAVREYSSDGALVWKFEDLHRPLDADRLSNGNTLIADAGHFRVIEVDPKGKIVWQCSRAHVPLLKPYEADRLTNGNTLICDYIGHRVIEVHPKGKIVWSRDGIPFVCEADRLSTGHTLITLRQPPSVLEVGRDGDVVWSLEGLQLPWDADRLPNGNTMVAENHGVRIYGRDGKLVHRIAAEWPAAATRY